MKTFAIFNRISTLVLLGSIAFGCKNVEQLLQKNGTAYTVEIVAQENSPKDTATSRTIGVLKSRLDALGLSGVVSPVEGQSNRIQVLVSGEFDGERVKKFLFTTNKLQLKKVAEKSFTSYPSEDAARNASPDDADIVLLVDASRKKDNDPVSYLRLEKSAVISGADLKDAYASQDSVSGNYSIMFTLTPQGAEKFGDWTGRNIGRYLAIVLDDKVISAPVIRGQIFDNGSIDGYFDKQSAEDLALSLRSGYLDVSMTVLDERLISY